MLARSVFVIIELVLISAVVYAFFSSRGGLSFFSGIDINTFSLRLAPLFGLLAFLLVWTQIIIGPHIRIWLKVFPRILRYHRFEGIFAFIFACLHPLLMLVAVGISNYLSFSFVSKDLVIYAILGEVQFVLLIVTVLTALLRNRPWLIRRWRIIHYLNYVIFVSAFIHSIHLGSDLQGGFLRTLWIFFGITGICSIGLRIWRAIRQHRIKTAVQTA